MKGREGDEWQRSLTRAKPEELLRTLALAGFRGLYIDREGYADRAKALESELAKRLGAEAFVSADGKRSFFDLSGYAERLRARYSPEEWDEMGRAVREPLCVLWQDGCFRFSPPEQELPFVWCQRRGHFAIVNPSDRPRRAELLVVCRTRQVEPARLRFASDLFATDTLINSVAPQMRYAFTVPPGRHLVSFECDPPKGFVPEDSRRRVFFMGEFTLRETDAAACPAEQASR